MHKTSKKRGFCLDDYPLRALKKGVKIRKFNPKEELDGFMNISRDQYVGLSRRVCAHLLDVLIVLVLTALSLLLVFSLRPWVSEAALVLCAIAFFLNGIPVSWLYFAGMES